MVKNKNKKPPARINFEKKKDDKLRFFLSCLMGFIDVADNQDPISVTLL